MKFLINFFPLVLCATNLGPLDSREVNASIQKQEHTASAAATSQIDKSVISGHPTAQSGGTSDVMIIDPKVMSQDWFDAFQALKAKKLTNITFGIKGDASISDVTNVEILSGGYLMLFSIKTIQGPKYQIVKTSDITSLTCK